MATAWLEPYQAGLRIGANGATHYDPFTQYLGVRYFSPYEAEICGLVDKNPPDTPKDQRKPAIKIEDWRAIIEAFRKTEVRRLLYQRVMPDGSLRQKWVNVQ